MEKIITDWINIIVNYLGFLGPIAGIVLVIIESIIPILPLAVFIALNFQAFGLLFGFIISWLSTIMGCIIAYKLSSFLSNKYYKGSKNIKLNNMMENIHNIGYTKLVIIMAIPFLPAFLINIASGLCKIDLKKFILSLLIGKLSIVYFWGYIGTSFLESITDLRILIKIGIIMLVVYLISKIVSKKMKI